MVAYKIPAATGEVYSWLVMAVLLLMLPAKLAAPLASGAVGWQNVTVYPLTTKIKLPSGNGRTVTLSKSAWGAIPGSSG